MGTYRLDFEFRGGDLRLTGVSDSGQKAILLQGRRYLDISK